MLPNRQADLKIICFPYGEHFYVNSNRCHIRKEIVNRSALYQALKVDGA